MRQLWVCADELRLADGGSPCSGRVEVKHQDRWGTVCSYHWDVTDAGVVCKQLGCGAAVGAPGWGHFGAGSGPIWLDKVACAGTESALWHCRNSGWETNYCDHDWDAGVTCSGHIKPQLVGGDGACSGRVEIKLGNTWTTVCDAHFDLQVANVICNELQCGIAVSTPGGGHFGEGQGLILTEEFRCVGNESLLFSCPRISKVNQSCSHTNDAGVICSRFRLVNGSTACSGRVEIQVLGAWGTLCDSRWDLPDANVLCRQLDCGFAVSAPGGGYFGKGTGSVWTDTFHCKGTETHLGHCSVTALGASQCSHDNDASVVCSVHREGGAQGCPSEPWDPKSCDNRAEETHISCTGKKPKPTQTLFAECPNSPSCTDQEKLRIVGGEDRCLGRVEVWYRGSWGTVCDDSWDMADANVLCKQLGCGSALSAPDKAAFGEGTGPIWVETLNCRGTESSLWDCPAKPWGESNCGHKEDAAVNCSAPPRRPPTDSGRVTVPVVICIILGALLCLVLIILGAQVRSARAQLREGVSPGGSQLDYDNVEEPAFNNVPQTPDSRDAPALPGDVPGAVYDDAREVSVPEGGPGLGQNDEKGTGASDRDAQTAKVLKPWSMEYILGQHEKPGQRAAAPFQVPSFEGSAATSSSAERWESALVKE
ncbi:unnamed protein product [Caretta caretta]